MAALHMQVPSDPQPNKNIAAESFDRGHALDCRFRISAGYFGADRPLRQTLDDLPDEAEALFDLTNADPYPRVDVAVLTCRHLEGELVVLGIAG